MSWSQLVTNQHFKVRLVKNPSGKSRGFAYVEFSSKIQAENCLKFDRKPINNRPVYIAQVTKEKKGHQFRYEPFGHTWSHHCNRYETGIELNKLFVKNLPQSCQKEDLQKFFGKFGEIKDIRIVTYR